MSLLDCELNEDESNEVQTGTAINVQTGETNGYEITLGEIRDITFDIEFDHCTGECECQIESDGVCSEGWPSRLSAAGYV